MINISPEIIETYNLDLRKNILIQSLILEGMSSHLLSVLLNIPDYKTSISFGNTNKSLSFNQKINLLIDIEALNNDSQTKTKFEKFMAIRNQFMHNLLATSYVNCISETHGLDGYLHKTYKPDMSLTHEDRLKYCVEKLGEDVVQLSFSIFEKIQTKFSNDTETRLNDLRYKSIIPTINRLSEVIDEIVNTNYTTKIEKNNINIKDTIYQNFYLIWDVEYNKKLTTNEEKPD